MKTLREPIITNPFFFFLKKIKYRTIINPFKFECIHNMREGVQKVRGGQGMAPTSTTGVRY